MISDRKFIPYIIIFFTVVIALIWRPYYIGFYGDDAQIATANSWHEAWFYARRERIFYFYPLAIPRYFFGHDQIGWGWYAISLAGLTAMAIFSFLKNILVRLSVTKEFATLASVILAIVYIFMPWNLAIVLWNTTITQLVMVAFLALAGTVLFSNFSTLRKTVLFVVLFSVSSLIYETIWGAWIPLIIIKLILDKPTERKETFIIAGWATLTQIALIANYLPSIGISVRVMAGGEFALSSKLILLVENIFVRTPFELVSSMGVLGLLAIPFILFIVYWIVKNRYELTNSQFWLIALSCLAGILGGILVVTLGNYRITATTDDARFMAAISIWIALLMAMVTSIVLSKGTKNLRISSYIVFALIVGAFFLRSNDWVQGYFFQRHVIDSIPIEDIAGLLDKAPSENQILSGEVRPPILVVEFDTPLHVFHGWANTQAMTFIAKKIKREANRTVTGVASDGRLWKTALEGTRFYQYRCANQNEFFGDNIMPADMIYIYWRIKTGEVRKITSPFSTGCTRTIHRFEVLGELLYPFMGNPRRP